MLNSGVNKVTVEQWCHVGWGGTYVGNVGSKGVKLVVISIRPCSEYGTASSQLWWQNIVLGTTCVIAMWWRVALQIVQCCCGIWILGKLPLLCHPFKKRCRPFSGIHLRARPFLWAPVISQYNALLYYYSCFVYTVSMHVGKNVEVHFLWIDASGNFNNILARSYTFG